MAAWKRRFSLSSVVLRCVDLLFTTTRVFSSHWSEQHLPPQNLQQTRSLCFVLFLLLHLPDLCICIKNLPVLPILVSLLPSIPFCDPSTYSLTCNHFFDASILHKHLLLQFHHIYLTLSHSNILKLNQHHLDHHGLPHRHPDPLPGSCLALF